MRLFRTATAAMALATATISAPLLADDHNVAQAVEADYDSYLAPLFVHFHKNPELSFLENKTAARMAEELRSTGIEVTENVGGTGVVGMLRNGDGPLILLRADMDGLPVEEKSGLDYASTATQVGQDGKEYPVMHACGHDVHITSMVGTARWLVENMDAWSGTIMFVVQPAEERVGGAKAMLADGLYDRFGKPDYALAFHVASVLPTGMVSASEKIQYSSADSVDIMVPGIGAHGASPHMGKDPVYIGSQIVTALQSIVSREVMPLSPGVITVGKFQAGSKHNIISDRADLQLTVRANDEDTRAQLLAAIERIAVGIGKAHGLPDEMPVKVTVSEGTPVTNNDPELARRLNAVMKRELGEDAFMPFEQRGMGAEDFAYFVADEYGVPGYYFAVGGTPQAAFDAEAEGGPSGLPSAMIIVASGISASGKTTWIARQGVGTVIAEHGALPDAPGQDAPLGEQAVYWTRRNCERWQAAIEAETKSGLALCDSDPLKLHFQYSLWRVGQASFELFEALARSAREAIRNRQLGFADHFYVSPLGPEEARVLRSSDPTRRRRNFERNALLYEPLTEWYRALGALIPERVTFEFPEKWKPPQAPMKPRRYDPSLLDQLIERLVA